MNHPAPFDVVLAILTVGDGYVLQLRDDLPHIASPGQWALFGGGMEAGEEPRTSIRREIHEELTLDVTEWRSLWTVRWVVPVRGRPIRHHVFAADVTDVWGRHRLREGQATRVFRLDALPEPIEPIAVALLERYHDEVGRKAP